MLNFGVDNSPASSLCASLQRCYEELSESLIVGGAAGVRLALFALVAAWAVYAAHWPLFGVVIPWDAKDFYYPVLRALAAARATGESGFWNPFLFSGSSAIADPQSWLFTPGFRLLAELNEAPSMMLADQVQLLHLLGGGLGLFALLRTFGYVPAAALLAALIFMFGGVAASRLQHSLMTVSYAYLPWALWLLHRALHSETRKSRLIASLGFGIVGGVMALNRDQVAFLNFWLLIGVALWWLRGLWKHGERLRAIVLLPTAVIGSVILALPMLLTLDALVGSTRPEIGYAIAVNASQQPASLLTLFAPNIFGNLDAGSYWGPGQLPWMALAPHGNDWSDQTTNYLYIGAVPMALLLTALARRGRWPAGSCVFAVGALFALLYALGAFTPAFRLFYDWLPGVSLYRRPNDAAFLLNAMLALLVGAAAEKWLRQPQGWSRRGLAISGSLLLIVIVGALWLAERFSHLPGALTPLAFGLAGLAAALAMLQWGRAGLLPLCLFAAVDLIAHNAIAPFNAHPQISLAAYQPEGERLAQAIRERLAGPGGPYRAEIFGLGGDWQNAAMVYGIEQTLGYSPLRRADYAAATGAYQNNHEPERRLTAAFTGYDSPLARLLGIKLIVTGQSIEKILPPQAHRSLRLVDQVGGAFLYENDAVLPRVLLVGRAEPDDGSLPDDPEARVTIAGLAAPAGEPGVAGQAGILARSRDELRLAATAGRPAYLVINELYDPGWTARTAAGERLELLRANGLFRAIALPAGATEISLRYEPLARRPLVDMIRRIQP
jgi:hypothetical protein